jgi:hypothetical protein
MERFFTRTQRLQDEFICGEYHGYTEVQLAVSIEAFLNHRWDWSDFLAFATGGDEVGMEIIMFITDDTFIWVEEGNSKTEFDQVWEFAVLHAVFTSTSGETRDLVLAKFGNSASLSAGASRVFWHAVTTSKCVKLKLSYALVPPFCTFLKRLRRLN